MAPDLFWKCPCGYSENLVVTCPKCGTTTHPEMPETPEEAIMDILVHLKKIDQRLASLENYVNTHRFCRGQT